MSELLIELFSEEIPALMQKAAEAAYYPIFEAAFAASNIAFGRIEILVGPRRLSIYVAGLSKLMPAITTTIKGPKISAGPSAIEGFCRVNQVCYNQLSTILIKDQPHYACIKYQPESETTETLKIVLPAAIATYIWPKSMYWGNYQLKWVRPLRNILCLFDQQILAIQFGHLTGNNLTCGHRFMAPQTLKITNYLDYQAKLAASYVIISRQERRRLIEQQALLIANSHNLVIKKDDELVEEVAGLVEYPQVMIGQIPEKFLQLPPEVLTASMRTHQKYFSLYDAQGNFARYFLFVSNIKSPEPEVIISGNQKVLSARLADGWYFYHQDLAKGLKNYLPKLQDLIFHTKIGNLQDKTSRIGKICHYLAPNNQSLQIAAKLAKSDLVSAMVGEFPQLQGVMGYYYATAQGEESATALAIRDHYKPQGPSDNVPTGTGALLAIADKIDSLTGLMIYGEQASGSKDPYALRRLALGMIRIILENQLQLPIQELLTFAAGLFGQAAPKTIILFLEERAKFYFKSRGYDVKLISAVLDLATQDDLVVAAAKLLALQAFLASSQGRDLLIIYKRASNILNSEHALAGVVSPEQFTSDDEIILFAALNHVQMVIDQKIDQKDFNGSLRLLANLLIPVTNFFDRVMVNDQNLNLAHNRLLLLQKLKQLFHKVAKFDQL